MTQRDLVAACVAIAGTWLVGCGGLGETGRFDSRGFEHGEYRYAVRMGPDGRVLPLNWRLDNYQLAGGMPTTPKTGEPYLTRVAMDHDGDGRVDERVRMYRYDLRFRHTRDRGEIWLQTIPLSQTLAHTELRVLMRAYVDAVAGAGFVAVDFGGGVSAGLEQTFATRIVDSQVLTVHGLEAFAATVEVANVDQLRLSPEGRWERARVVMIRTPFTYFRQTSLGEASYPVLMLAGYSNLPEDFDAGLPAFEGLVERIVFLDAPPGVAPGVRVVSPPPVAVAELPPPPPAAPAAEQPPEGPAWEPPAAGAPGAVDAGAPL